MADGDWDYIIVGAGSAGCVLANRLTADGRAVHFPRGKVLGGSSAINGHLYVRGQAADFDSWAQMGNRGWSYADVLSYFRRSEDRSSGADEFHGAGGPQHVSDIDEHHPISEAFLVGAEELGLNRNPDYNGTHQEGVAYYQRTIKAGRRASAATSFLHPAMRHSNLHVITHALVTGLEIDGTKVASLRYRRGGQDHSVRAAREVILAAGAIGSPHLLQISGIGPPELLQRIGLPVRHALSGVGEGLRDHYAARVVSAVSEPITLNERAHGPRLWWEIAKWIMAGRGLLAFSPAHVAGFVRLKPEIDFPDLQLMFTPASYSTGVTGSLQRTPGMTAGFWQMRPESQGYVRARRADPSEAPAIQPNYLTSETDRQVAIAGIRWCRSLLATQALAPYRAAETLPGPDCQTDEDILAHIRQTGATVYHAIGTCRMGSDPLAVVDDRLRVHGIEGLRVIDASIMPSMPSANTNAATLMVAEKGSDLLLAGD